MCFGKPHKPKMSFDERMRFDEIGKGVAFWELKTAFLGAASAETSFDPDFYEKNKEVSKLTGHCYLCARFIKDEFGGEIIKGFVNGESHYWNRLSDGTEIDFTSCQFEGDGYRPVTLGEIDTREIEPFERYLKFKERVWDELCIQ